MPDFIDGFEAFARIRAFIRKKYGTQRKCARALGLSEGHLSDMLNSRCEISPRLLAAAGLVRRVVYEVRELPGLAEDDRQKENTADRPQRVPSLPLTGYRIGLTAEVTALGLNRPGRTGCVPPHRLGTTRP
ncbi:hypothetical protein J3T99_05490 [Acetobacteraceae bacterium B3987]|nr:hypothetical protein [Acetobacteraceae bacterium B3987]